LIGNRHTKKDNTCGIEGGAALTSFKNNVNIKTPMALSRKTEQFLLISTRLMMAE
jgi:hypothetical protein